MATVNLSGILGSPADRPPVSINGRGVAISLGSSYSNIGTPTTSGALTADTYKALLTLTAPGVLKMCAAWHVDAASRQIGLRVVIDGVTAYDVTTAATALANAGQTAAGFLHTSLSPFFDRIPFNTLEVSVKSSLTETDKVSALIVYDLV